MRSLAPSLLAVLLPLVAACGDLEGSATSAAAGGAAPPASSPASPPAAPSSSAPASSSAPVEPPPPPAGRGGWSVRDDAPYPRFDPVVAVDTQNDRLVMFGGAATDTWTMPLADGQPHVWTLLPVAGGPPPAHLVGDYMSGDVGFYDPVGQRLIVLVNSVPATASTSTEVSLWQLSLAGEPAWSPLPTAGPSPGAEIQSAQVAYDGSGHRAFFAGGALDQAGLWSLTLGATATWSRLAGAPAQDPAPAFYSDHHLLFDPLGQRLLMFGGHPRLGTLWGLPLATGAWAPLATGPDETFSWWLAAYGLTAALDEERGRLVLVGGDQDGNSLRLLSLATGEWTKAPLPAPLRHRRHGRAVVDRARDRLLHVGAGTSETWALSLATLEWTPLNDLSGRDSADLANRQLVVDPVRGAVVAYGGYQGGVTLAHGPGAGDRWTPLTDVGDSPTVSFSGGVHDPVGQAIVGFGGYAYQDSSAVVRLRSAPGSTWETLAVGPGPAGRWRHLSVYDPVGRRLVIAGGWRQPSPPSSEYLHDAWALSLDEPMAWTPLTATGPSPADRIGQLGAYDPVGHRVIAYGGWLDDGTALTDLWSLSLGATPAWQALGASGTGPGPVISGSLVHDPDGGRMILVDQQAGGSRVFALVLEPEPVWHRFCEGSLRVVASSQVVRVPDGLFASVNGGAFRFDLSTPYCD